MTERIDAPTPGALDNDVKTAFEAARSATPHAAPWQIGAFRFDPSDRSLTDGAGRAERISGKAAGVLLQLVEHGDAVVGRKTFIERVWDGNVHTGEAALTHTMSLLRRSLRSASGAADGEAIETISKSGYRLRWPARRLPCHRSDDARAPLVIDAAAAAAAAPALQPAVAPDDLPQPPAALAPGAPSAANHGTTSHRSVSGSPRARWLLAALLLLVAGLVSGTALWRGAAAEQRPIRPLTLLDGAEEWPAYSPDGRWLAYVWQRSGAASRLRLVDLHAPDAPAREFVDARGPILRPVWAGPDRLAYLQAEHNAGCRVVLLALRDDSRRDLADCVVVRGAAALAASPDGASLAYVRRSVGARGGQTLWLHRLADDRQRALAEAPAGEAFGQLSWSHDGAQIAALRLYDSVGEVLRLDVQTGASQQLTQLATPIWALAWSGDDRSLIFSAAPGGDVGLWQVGTGGGAPRRIATVESVSSLVTIPDGSGDVAASLRRFDDHIERRALAGGRLLESLRSSGRDLAAQACADAAHPLFVSMRARRIALWYRDGAAAEARELPLPEGTPEPPACSPDGRFYATAMTPAPGRPGNRLVVGRTDRPAEAPRVIELPAMLSSVQWSLDGRTLLMTGADSRGDAALWRIDPERGAVEPLAGDQARFGREVDIDERRWLYYARDAQPGLWRRTLDAAGRATGPVETVLEDLAPQDWANWQWHAGKLWRISRHTEADRLVSRDRTGQDTAELDLPAGSIAPFRALSIDARGEVLLARQGLLQADILRIPTGR